MIGSTSSMPVRQRIVNKSYRHSRAYFLRASISHIHATISHTNTASHNARILKLYSTLAPPTHNTLANSQNNLIHYSSKSAHHQMRVCSEKASSGSSYCILPGAPPGAGAHPSFPPSFVSGETGFVSNGAGWNAPLP